MTVDRAGRAFMSRRPGRCLGAAIVVALSVASVPAACHAGAHPTVDWDGEAREEAFHTTDLFPGGTELEADDGLRLDVRPALEIRAGGGVRVKPWVRLIAERYLTWHARDLERWSGGLDVKRGSHRLRLYGGWTPEELYFPSSSGGARLDRGLAGAQLRVGLLPGLLLQVEGEREHDDFNPIYDDRDATLWSVRTGLEHAFDVGRTISLSHLYRRNDSITDLYTYDHNALRGIVTWTLAPWTVHGEGEAALRNYRTPHAFDRNATRQDARWRIAAALGRALMPHVSAEAYGEYRRSDSTRRGKDYDVSSIGFALEVTR
jgi:hypothetical protein